MKKRTWRALALAAVLAGMLLCLTGCYKYELSLRMHLNGTYDYHLIAAFPRGEDDGDDEGLLNFSDYEEDEDYKKLCEEGYTAVPYSDDSYLGIAFERKGVSPEESIYLYPTSLDEKIRPFTISDGRYTFLIENIGAESTGLGTDDNTEPVFLISLTLPQKPIAHNATSVSKDGRTLTWNLFEVENDEDIYCEFRDPHVLLWSVLAACIAAAGLICFLSVRAAVKRKQAQTEIRDRMDNDVKQVEPVLCPRCGAAELTGDDRFCPRCGTKCD